MPCEWAAVFPTWGHDEAPDVYRHCHLPLRVSFYGPWSPAGIASMLHSIEAWTERKDPSLPTTDRSWMCSAVADAGRMVYLATRQGHAPVFRAPTERLLARSLHNR